MTAFILRARKFLRRIDPSPERRGSWLLAGFWCSEPLHEDRADTPEPRFGRFARRIPRARW